MNAPNLPLLDAAVLPQASARISLKAWTACDCTCWRPGSSASRLL